MTHQPRRRTTKSNPRSVHHHGGRSNHCDGMMPTMLLFVVLLIVAVLPQYYLMFRFAAETTTKTNASSLTTVVGNHGNFPKPPCILPNGSSSRSIGTRHQDGPPILSFGTPNSLIMPEPCLSYPINGSQCRVADHYWSNRDQKFYQPVSAAAIHPAVHGEENRNRNPWNQFWSHSRSKRTAAICLVMKNELLYLNEFIDYHLGIGFAEILIYDNSDDLDLHHNLRHWVEHVKGPQIQNHRISIQHWPGANQQVPAYQDCHQKLLQNRQHTWMAVLDVDERLVLKPQANYTHIVDLLEEYCPTGSVSFYWYYFGHANQTRYLPQPLAQRFLYRDRNAHVLYKTIGHISTINPQRFHVHYMKAIPPATHHDLLGNVLNGQAPVSETTVPVESRNRAASEIAAVHHYWSKSVEEFVVKACWRGRPVAGKGQFRNCDKSYAMTLGMGSEVRDDSAWMALKRVVPEYTRLDS